MSTPSPTGRRRPLRIGILGAARFAPFALIKHARALPDVEVVAVAEEYQGAAALAKYAKKHRIPSTHRSFDELLARADIDAVYVPLPISMHVEWTLRAIAAGKHVLCEKPMAANADEAARIASAAEGTGLIVAEAMHFRYHPLVERVRSLLEAGEIGELRSIDASFSAYLPFDDFRFDYRTGGGGTIVMGCYPVGFVRAVTGEEPVVEGARAILSLPVTLHGRVIGALRLYHYEVWELSDRDLDSLVLLSEIIGLALMYTRLRNALLTVKETTNEIHKVWLEPFGG